jgi:uncharacterized protein (DUF697 family)
MIMINHGMIRMRESDIFVTIQKLEYHLQDEEKHMNFVEPVSIEPVTMMPQEAPLEPEIDETISLRAENCIKNHVFAAMGIGFIPSAAVDVVGITAIEIKMIRNLAHIYSFPVPHKLVAIKVLISLIGSIGPVYVSVKMHSVLKGVPLLGYAVYAGLLSITGGAAVYAVGKIFQAHFESGGTFLSKDNKYIRDYFNEKYTEGKQTVKGYARKLTQPA